MRGNGKYIIYKSINSLWVLSLGSYKPIRDDTQFLFNDQTTNPLIINCLFLFKRFPFIYILVFRLHKKNRSSPAHGCILVVFKSIFLSLPTFQNPILSPKYLSLSPLFPFLFNFFPFPFFKLLDHTPAPSIIKLFHAISNCN